MRLITVLLFFSSIFTAGAQNLDGILKQLSNGSRSDTLIAFDRGNELGYIPLTVIKGKQQGTVFTIVAGIHGYEYPPVIAVQELVKEIDPNQLHGTLIILPIANIASFYRRSPFVNPIDGKNLNNVFPGAPSGTASEQIAHWITKEVMANTDIFLDIHGGDANEDLLPFICYYNNKDEAQKTAQARLLSEASGMEYIVSYPYTLEKTAPAKYAFKQAVQNGIVALSIEAGKLGTVQIENVTLIKNAVYNMLSHSGIYKTKKAVTVTSKKYLYNQSYVKVPGKGIFYSSIKSGDAVVRGANIGHITDEFGKTLYQITAPESGIVLYKTGTPPVNKDETLFCIGH
ncbi:MAG: M14 family metallopeptidase [Niabella sp.]